MSGTKAPGCDPAVRRKPMLHEQQTAVLAQDAPHFAQRRDHLRYRAQRPPPRGYRHWRLSDADRAAGNKRDHCSAIKKLLDLDQNDQGGRLAKALKAARLLGLVWQAFSTTGAFRVEEIVGLCDAWPPQRGASSGGSKVTRAF